MKNATKKTMLISILSAGFSILPQPYTPAVTPVLAISAAGVTAAALGTIIATAVSRSKSPKKQGNEAFSHMRSAAASMGHAAQSAGQQVVEGVTALKDGTVAGAHALKTAVKAHHAKAKARNFFAGGGGIALSVVLSVAAALMGIGYISRNTGK